jgi:hypothetical protein
MITQKYLTRQHRCTGLQDARSTFRSTAQRRTTTGKRWTRTISIAK